MNKTLRKLTLLSGLALLATVFIISGCSDNSPLRPVQPQIVPSSLIAIDSSPISVTLTSDSSLISKDLGGAIEIARDSYVHVFEVQAGALAVDTEITVKSSKETIYGKSMIVFEFGPDGLVFSKAASLQFQMAELNARAVSGKLYYYDPRLKSWVYQGSSAVNSGVVSFGISHFSKYAISD